MNEKLYIYFSCLKMIENMLQMRCFSTFSFSSWIWFVRIYSRHTSSKVNKILYLYFYYQLTNIHVEL